MSRTKLRVSLGPVYTGSLTHTHASVISYYKKMVVIPLTVGVYTAIIRLFIRRGRTQQDWQQQRRRTCQL